MLLRVVPHLFYTYGIAVGYDVPVGKRTVDARDGIPGELEHLESRFLYLYLLLCKGIAPHEGCYTYYI